MHHVWASLQHLVAKLTPLGNFEKLALWSAVEVAAGLFASGLAVSKPLINVIKNQIRPEPEYHSKLIISVEVEEKTVETSKSEASIELGPRVVPHSL